MARSYHSREGVIAWVAQPSFDTPVTPTTSPGICEFNVTDDGDFRQIFTVGKANLHKNKPGIAKTPFSVTIPNLQTVTFLARGLRSSGVVPYNTIAFGTNDGSSPEQWQVSDCILDQLEVSLDGGGFLSGSASGTGRVITLISSLSAVHITADPLMSYEGVLTYGGAAFEVKSFRMNVNHNHTLESTILGAARSSGKKRYWDYQTPGHEVISGTVSLTRKISVGSNTAFGTDCMVAGSNASLALTDVCDGAHTFTVSLTQMEFKHQARNTPLDGLIGFELAWDAYGWNLT